MRSIILSFTALVALGVAPAFAQMGPNNGMAGGQQPMQGSQTEGSGMGGQGMQGGMTGEYHAPPDHVPVVNHPTNLTQSDTHSIISPALPPPPVGPNATATEYLRAARASIEHGQLGRAQSSLENAETYLLNRSVPMGAANQPDQNPAIGNIEHALDALAHHHRGEAISLIDQTIPMARQSEMAMQQGGPQMGPGMNEGGMSGQPGMANGQGPMGQGPMGPGPARAMNGPAAGPGGAPGTMH